MWSPPNKHGFPSPEEIIYAKETINTLENALRDAFELIKSTKLRIAELKRDLEERKGWIAPIRKVPTEVLADILLFASEMDDLAPVKISAVSRFWRDIILATPKAWSFIHLKRHHDKHIHLRRNQDYHGHFHGYKNTYFQRSKPRLLHLCLPGEGGYYAEHSNSIIKEQVHRIQCLTTSADVLSDAQSAPECQKFPYLHTLTLANEVQDKELDTSFFTISKFPALQNLRWPCCSPLTSASPTICPSFFPPLQHLSISMEVTSSMDILQSCAATLKSLDISWKGRNGSTTQISFPLLRYLTISGWYHSKGRPSLVKAITPALTSLEVRSSDWSITPFFDADIQKVTHMRWYSLQKPLFCTHVRVLQITVFPDNIDFTPGEYAECANKLKEIACAYPSLERIELSNELERRVDIALMQQKVEECLGEEFVKPQLLWTSDLHDVLPGEMV
jgi:F-box-like